MKTHSAITTKQTLRAPFISASLSLLIAAALVIAAAAPAGAFEKPFAGTPERIVLGAAEPDHQFPWVVNVVGATTGKGVLISPIWVLTTAHVAGPGFTGVRVTYSRTAPNGVSTSGSLETGGGSVYVHPDYVPGAPYADLALVRLPAPFEADPYLQPADLPRVPAEVGQQGTVVASGNPSRVSPGHLTALRSPILGVGGPSPFGLLSIRSDVTSLCPRDNGSGFITVREGIVNVVTGIASLAMASDCGRRSQQFDVVDVYQHVGWIRTTTAIGFNDNAFFYKTDGAGGIERMRSHEFYGGWDIIVPGNFGGDGFGDMLFYNSLNGFAMFVTTDGAGGIRELKLHRDWDKGWNMIVPGDFGGDGYTDLLFYKRATGHGAFYSTDGRGGINLLSSYSNWDTTWDIIVPGSFADGDAWTDLFFYDRENGVGLFEGTNGQGGIFDLQGYSDLDRTWDIIVPGDFGDDAATDLLFYNRRAGIGYFCVTDGRGGIRDLATHRNWDQTWSTIVPGNFGGNSRTDLFFFSFGSEIGHFAATDGQGGISELRTHTNMGKFWERIVPGQFGGGPSTDLFFYKRA